MPSVTSSVGLASGVDYGSLVEQLMKLNSASRDALNTRNEQVKKEQAAVTTLSALLLGVQYVAQNLGKEDLFNTRAATSSNDALATATVTGSPEVGNYQFSVLRTAQQQQFLSAGFKSDSTPIGAGKLTIRHGNNLERSLDSSQINGGAGITRGKIRITDRSGEWAEIDLTAAQSIDDVLNAINNSTGINVTAVANGDRIRLIDNTGQTTSNLKVQEVGRGTTAASLGLADIDEAASTADGDDLVRLTEDTSLALLNEGAGVEISTVLPDISYTLADGTTGKIDFSPLAQGETKQLKEFTLGDILEVINNAAPGKLKAEINADGDRLVVSDLTSGEGAFTLKSAYAGGSVLDDLGLAGQAVVGGRITGGRIQGGLKSVLLSGLNGGQGLGTLGELELIDRSGAGAVVNLIGSETLDDVISRINDAGIGIKAQLNQAKNGLELIDTTGATTHNLIVTDHDGTSTATKLGLAVNKATTSVSSGDMHLQVVSRNTNLATLNGGDGVARGSFQITDSTGRAATINLSSPTIQTMGDVIDAINHAGVGIVADLNATGDGIRIYDVAQGSGTLKISEGTGTTAADLHLLGGTETQTVNGVNTQVVDGSMTTTIELTDEETLASLITKINGANAGVTAAKFVDGSSNPYRLSLKSQLSGKAGNVVIDTSGLNFAIDEIVQGADALIAMGNSTASNSVLVSSTSNTFTNVITGVNLNVKQASSTPVTVSVSTSSTNFVASVQTLVTNYNKFRDQLLTASRYDADANVKGVLTGDSSVLRLDTDLSRLLSSRFSVGESSVHSLGQLGISFNDDGTLSLDQAKLDTAYAIDPEGVKTFFTDKDGGFAKQFNDLCETLVGQDVSLMAQRYKSLQNKIDENAERLTTWDEKLTRQRDRLLNSFYNMENAIAKLQSNMTVITSLQSQLDSFSSAKKK